MMHVDELKLLGLEPKLIEKALELSLQAVLTTTRLDSPTTYVAGPTRGILVSGACQACATQCAT